MAARYQRVTDRICRDVARRMGDRLWSAQPGGSRSGEEGSGRSMETKAETTGTGPDRPWRTEFAFRLVRVAEDGGFEPPRALTQPAFQV